jgi:TetR/AcrR family transcriptional regulator, mexJK operon transcriptional repressor
MAKRPAAPPAGASLEDFLTREGPGGKVGQILVAARHLFLERGFGNTSMDAIAKQAGVSKATLYVHFTSKESMFAEVVSVARSGLNRSIAAIAERDMTDPAETLRQIGREFLRFVTTAGVLTLFRAVIGETQRFPDLGKTIFLSGSSQMLDMIAASISRAHERGLLVVPDPGQAAAQFVALTKSDLHLHCLLEPEFQASDEAIERNVDAAVAVFMSHYGPRPLN